MPSPEKFTQKGVGLIQALTIFLTINIDSNIFGNIVTNIALLKNIAGPISMGVADKTELRCQVVIASCPLDNVQCPVLPGDTTMINRKYCD